MFGMLTSRKTVILVALALVASFGALAIAPSRAAAQENFLWTAEFFDNPQLAGTPVQMLQDSDINENYGTGAPVPGVPVDNFSIRWTAAPTLSGGVYRLSVFVDDGVRVYVDGVLTIDAFQPAPGASYSEDVDLVAGQHTFVVEYYEAGGPGYISFDVTRTGDVVTPPVTGPQATVLAYYLNVRDAPSAIVGNVLTVISRSEMYPVLGQNLDGSWWLLDVDGTQGWVNGAWVDVTGAANVPVVGDGSTPSPTPNPTPAPPATDSVATVLAGRLNVRNAPSVLTGEVITQVSAGEVYPVVGRNVGDDIWWLIDVNGTRGWVSGTWVNVINTDIVPFVE